MSFARRQIKENNTWDARVILTYRFRILPSKRQHRALERILETQRQLYNAALEERIDAFRKAGVTRTFFDQCKALTEWRKSDDEASSLPVRLQRGTLKRLDEAYRGFFRRLRAKKKAGFPRFRGRGWFNSFCFQSFSGISLQNGRMRFKGMPGSLRIHAHRPIPSQNEIRRCIFRRDARGWYVSLATRVLSAAPRSGDRRVGIDVGVRTLAVLSDGGFVPSLRAARRAARRLRVLQRALARTAKGSRGRRIARNAVARGHAAIARQRANYLHQASARMVRDYDVIAVERMRIEPLARSFLAKDVLDGSWRTFISMLRYKAEKAGARMIEVDSRNTSQDCSACSRRVPKRLGDRYHRCSYCGLQIDRDLNAARNILNRAGVGPGLRNVADGGMRAGENLVSARSAL
jgi:putative transposase